MKKKIALLGLASMMALSSAMTAFATPLDILHKTDGTKNAFSQVARSASTLRKISQAPEDYVIEGTDGKYYNVEEVLEKTEAGLSFEEAIAELEPVDFEAPEEPEVPGEDLQVISVTATSNTSVTVNFNDVIEGEVVAADFAFDNGLTVLSAEKQSGNKRVVLTTSAQVKDTVYALSFKGVSTGKTIKGLEAAVEKDFDILEASANSNTSVRVILKEDPLVNLTQADFNIDGLEILSLVRSNNVVTLRTSSQTAGTLYTVEGRNGGKGSATFTGHEVENTDMVLENVETVNLRQIRVDFKEPVLWSTAKEKANYYLGMVEETDGNVQTNSLKNFEKWTIKSVDKLETDSDDNVLSTATTTSVFIESIEGGLITQAKDDGLGLVLNETATLEVRNLKRNYVNTSQKHFTVKDNVKPTVASVTPVVYIGNEGATLSKGETDAHKGILAIKYSEPVQTNDENSAFEVRLDGKVISKPDVISNTTVAAHSGTTLNINPLLTKPGTYKITFTGIKDLNDNIQGPNPQTLEFEVRDYVKGENEQEIRLEVKDIRQIADNAIELQFNKKGVTFSDLGNGEISFLASAYENDGWKEYKPNVTDFVYGTNDYSKIVVFDADAARADKFSYNSQDQVKREVIVKGDDLKSTYRQSLWFIKDTEAPEFVRNLSTHTNNTASEKALYFVFEDGPFAKPNGEIELDTSKLNSGKVQVTRTDKNNQTYVSEGEASVVGLDKNRKENDTAKTVYHAIKVVIDDIDEKLLTDGKFVNGESYTVLFPEGSVKDELEEVGNASDKLYNVEGQNSIEELEATVTINIEEAAEEEGRVPQTTKGLIETNKAATITDAPGFEAMTDLTKNQIAVFFDGEVEPDTAKKLANYTLDGKALPQGTKIDFFEEEIWEDDSIEASIDGTEESKTAYVVITLQDGTVEETGLYDFTVKGITNKKGKFMLPVDASVELEDNTAPEMVAVAVEGSKDIIVEFNEVVKVEASSDAKVNFEVIVKGKDANERIAVEKVEVIEGTRTIKLTLVQDIENAKDAKIEVSLIKSKDGDKKIYIIDESALENRATAKTVRN